MATETLIKKTFNLVAYIVLEVQSIIIVRTMAVSRQTCAGAESPSILIGSQQELTETLSSILSIGNL